jgi:serine/threonine protein kinase
MELMGKSLEDIFEKLEEKKMSLRCVCNIGYQMMEILEYIHNKHYIHRDIKPDNFVIGRKEKRKYIYILDFGLSKKYRSSKTLEHYKMVKKNNLTGTARYASINALNGLTQSRRDDLEAVGYVLIYFLRGKLPWQGIPVQNKEMRYKKILEKKMSTSPEELCEGFPNQFTEYIKYTRNLNYEENPDYDYLKNLFIKMLNSDGFGVDCYYDWDKETINYFRDFKSEDNKNCNNKNKNDFSSPKKNKQLNEKDVNIYVSNENKKYIRFSNYNTSNTNQENNNSISIAYNMGNTTCGINGSSFNIEGPIFILKQNNQEIIIGNENVNQIQKNNMENVDHRYNLENKENINLLNK